MNLRDLGEFNMIQRIAPLFAREDAGTLGIGDDCAILPWGEGRSLLATTDMLIEGSHFLIERISPEDLGHKALAVNLSDIAAMGGKPLAAFLSVGLPSTTTVEWIDRFFAGLAEQSRAAACPLLGGDTTKSPGGVVINITVLGTIETALIKTRAGAKPGDVLAVTGNLGDSGGGLKLLLATSALDTAAERSLMQAHHRPVPHMAEGQWLAERTAVHAMMDVSDGLGSDVRRIMEQSKVGAEIQLDGLPVSPALQEVARQYQWDAASLAVGAGEDYCLLCAVDAPAFPETSRAFEADFGRPLFPVGRIIAGHDLVFRVAGEIAAPGIRGFDHFKT